MASRRQLFTRVLPLTLAAWTAGVVASYLQHGFLIGGERGVPLAGPECDVSLWHLRLLGFGGGYAMALVGGGFLLVPILAEFYRLPMRVIVAASIPFVIVLSGANCAFARSLSG